MLASKLGVERLFVDLGQDRHSGKSWAPMLMAGPSVGAPTVLGLTGVTGFGVVVIVAAGGPQQ